MGNGLKKSNVETISYTHGDAEEALYKNDERYRRLFETAQDGIMFLDAESGAITDANPSIVAILGYSLQELIGKRLWEIGAFVDVKESKAAFEQLQKKEYIRYEDLLLKTKNGQNRQVEFVGNVYPINGNKVIQCNFRDITERKQTENSLRESEERFSNAFAHASIGVALVALDGRWLKVNQALCNLVGYTEAELLTLTFQDITHREDLEVDLEIVRRMVAGEISSYKIEKRYIHARGHLVTVLLDVSVVRDEQGQPLYFIAQIQDITERKKTENTLRESDEKFHQLADNITDAFWIRSPDMSVLHYVSPAFEQIWGRTVSSLYANPHQWEDFILPEDRTRVLDAFGGLTADAPSLDIEYRIVRPNSEIRWVHVRGFKVRDTTGNLIRHIGIVTDITERKNASELLRMSEEHYRKLMETLPYGVIVHSQGRIVFANQASATIVGTASPSDVIGKSVMEFIHPDYREPALKRMQQSLRDGISLPLMEEKFVRLDGRVIDTEVSVVALSFAGQPARLTVFNDITERKRTEEALSKSEMRFRQIIETTQQGVLVHDSEGKLTLVNQRLADMLGYTIEELMGKSMFDFLDEEGKAIAGRHFVNAPKGINAEFDFKSTRKDGTALWMLVNGSPMFDSDHNYVGSLAMLTDITERKRVDEALRESEERFRHSFEYAAAGICIVGIDFKFQRINKTFREMIGFDEDEIKNLNFSDITHPEDVSTSFDQVKQMLQGKVDTISFEKRYISKDKRTIWGHVSISLAKDIDHKPQFFIVQLIDITERKQVEESLRESEERLRITLEATNIGTWDWDLKNDVWHTSSTYYTMLGYEPDPGQIDREVWLKRAHPDDRPVVAEKIKNVLNGSNSEYQYEARIKHADGSYRWLNVIGHAIKWDKESKPTRLIGMRTDITERKRAEEELQFKNLIMSTQQETSIDGILIVDENANIISYNRRFIEMWGIPPEMVKQKADGPVLNFVTTMVADPMSFQQRIQYLYEHKQETSWDEIVLKNGSIFDRYSAPMVGPVDRYYGRVWYFRDITARKQAEELLHESEEKFRIITEDSADAIFVIDNKGRYNYVNSKAASMLGYSKEELLSFTIVDVAPKNRVEEYFQLLQRLLQEGKFFGEIELVKKNGNVIPVDFNAVLLPNGFLFASCRDITVRKQAERQITLLAHTMESITECVSITDMNDNVLFVNNAFLKTYGYSEQEIVGKNINIVRSPNNPPEAVRGILATTLAGGWSGELVNRTKDGRDFTISLSTSFIRDEHEQVVALVGVATDITARRKSEEKEKTLEGQLQQAQKLESLGTLASGVAHDFNNILGIIMGHSSLLGLIKENPQKFSKSTEAILKATQRGASLVKQLLTFARKTEPLFETVSVNEMINEIDKLLHETIHKTIIISVSLQQDLPTIFADPNQIHQVLLNLCVNARDAMPKGGTLSISSGIAEGESINLQFASITARHYVRIEVADTGTGMDESTRQRIFEPFFTTKDLGKGTGLGLSVVFGIVQHHKGFIDVRSAPGKGTCFSVYLPVPERPVEVLQPARMNYQEIRGGSETILIIEDEVVLKDLMDTALVSKGYTVLTAQDGIKGIEMYQNHQNRIALVISDLGLPALDGQDVFKKIREINPQAKIIIASGFINLEMKSEMFKAGLKNFIQKPYLLEDVLQKVRDVIDAKG